MKDIFSRRLRVPRLPFGFVVDDDDPKYMVPIPEMTEILKEALNLYDQGTGLTECVNFLNSRVKALGYDNELSLMGFKKTYLKAFGRPTPEPLKKVVKKVKKSREELALERKAKKLAVERRKMTAAQKKLQRLEADVSGKKEEIQEELKTPHIVEFTSFDDSVLETIQEAEDEIAFKPNEGPQREFLSASEFQVLYGGAAGGGKSYALIADPIRYFSNKNFRGLLLRRTNDELKEIKWKSQDLYGQIFPKGHPNEMEWREKDSEFRFKNGGRLWITYLDRDEDVKRYHGQSFTWVGFDELTYYPTPYAWDYLATRVRTTDPELKPYLSMRATTNPGGPGHGWVKRMFIDPSPPNKRFWATNIETGETMLDPADGRPLFYRRFIPAKLSDNPYLAEDGIYRRNILAQGNERTQAQLLEGDWGIADGAAFPEFRVATHVIEPFEIPSSWHRFRSMDWGYQSKHAIHWYAVDPKDNQLIVYREFYQGGKTAQEVAEIVKILEKGENVSYGMLDSSVWHQRSEGPSPAEIMIAHGCRWRPADRSPGSRIAGKNLLHQLLRIQDSGRPGIVFFDTCRNIISDLQVAPADPNGGDDIDERYRQKNHAYDSLRYGISSRPRARDPFEYTRTVQQYRPVDRVFGY